MAASGRSDWIGYTGDVSVADELEFDALSERTKKLAERVVLHRAEGSDESAYEQGYDVGREKGRSEGKAEARAELLNEVQSLDETIKTLQLDAKKLREIAA